MRINDIFKGLKDAGLSEERRKEVQDAIRKILDNRKDMSLDNDVCSLFDMKEHVIFELAIARRVMNTIWKLSPVDAELRAHGYTQVPVDDDDDEVDDDDDEVDDDDDDKVLVNAIDDVHVSLLHFRSEVRAMFRNVFLAVAFLNIIHFSMHHEKAINVMRFNVMAFAEDNVPLAIGFIKRVFNDIYIKFNSNF